MNRFVTLAALVAVVGSLGAPASAATMTKASSKSMSSTTCPKGQTYTKGYKKKNGTMVKGYCHK